MALVLVLMAAAWWWHRDTVNPEISPGALRGANLLLVTIDTLRADRVGGPTAPHLTPGLQALAAAGVRFTKAYAHVPLTLPSHASIMTGLTPLGHGVRDNGSYRLAGARVTLAEIVKAADYRTGAFIGAFVLDSRFGLSQGFDEYDDQFNYTRKTLASDFVQRRADEVLRRAADWIVSGDMKRVDSSADTTTPWFAWVHLFDPHSPYDAPEQRVSDPYDNEVAFTDAQLDRFLMQLRQAGELANTLMVVTADHGEALGDHGEVTHSLFAYNSTLRVPLILTGPGIRPAVRGLPVSHVDLLPTVVDLLGLEVPPDVQGRSLRAELGGTEILARPVYFEALSTNLTRNWAPLTGIVSDDWKFIDLPIPELYDLDADPGETENLFDSDPERGSMLRSRLAELRTELDRPQVASGLLIDADTRSRLRALGYTAGGARRDSSTRRFTEADDPKTLLELHLTWHRVLEQVESSLESSGGEQPGLQVLQEFIEHFPQFAPAYTSAATLLIDLARPAEAVHLLDEALGRGLRTDAVLERLGTALLDSGEPVRAAAVFEPLVAGAAPWADDVNKLGAAYAAAGRIEDARRQFLRAIEIGPTAEIWKNLGVLDVQSGNLEKAVGAFREATRADPSYGPGWRLLGTTLQETDPAGAIDAWRRTVELRPEDAESLFDLVRLLADVGRPQEARPYVERYLADASPGTSSAPLERAKQILAALDGR